MHRYHMTLPTRGIVTKKMIIEIITGTIQINDLFICKFFLSLFRFFFFLLQKSFFTNTPFSSHQFRHSRCYANRLT